MAGSICQDIKITVTFNGPQLYSTNGEVISLDRGTLAVCDERMDRLDELSVVDRLAAIEKEVKGEW